MKVGDLVVFTLNRKCKGIVVHVNSFGISKVYLFIFQEFAIFRPHELRLLSKGANNESR